MTQATTQYSVTSQTIAVEHVRVSSGRSFADVRRKLEGRLVSDTRKPIAPDPRAYKDRGLPTHSRR